ncbi:MAG TPA: hypothetical protein VHQ47_18245, partial [Phycisphaerae bacterium]|nr:hypothetical protein [Phycisphaerae bacterium]
PAPVAPAPAAPTIPDATALATPVTPTPAAPATVPDIFPPGPSIPRVMVPATPAKSSTSARDAAPAAQIQVSDIAALRTAARNATPVSATGAVAGYALSTSGDRQATLTFSGAPNFSLIVPGRLFSAMTKKFGGKDGNGVQGKSVRFTGTPQLTGGKISVTLSSTTQIEIAP